MQRKNRLLISYQTFPRQINNFSKAVEIPRLLNGRGMIHWRIGFMFGFWKKKKTFKFSDMFLKINCFQSDHIQALKVR